jgi:hypothetical protein
VATATPTRRRPKAAAPKPAPIKAAKVTIKFEDLADFDESVNLLIVGDSGAGKTVLAGGAPNLLFLSTENGTISAKRQGSKAKLARLKNWLEVEAVLDQLDEELEAGTCKFKWLCLDSLPKMQTMLRQHLLDIGVLEGRKGADEDSLQLQDYNKWYNMFLRFVNRLVDMPINVIFTSTSMRIETEDDNGDPQDIVLPAIEGKAKEGYAIAQKVCAAMSSVWFLNIEGKGDRRKRVLYTQRRPPYFAKCRYSVLPGRLVLAPNDPTTMARLLAKIDAGEVLEEEDNTDVPDEELEDFEDEDLDDELVDALEEPEPAPPVKAGPATRARRAAKKPEPEEEDEDEFEEPDAPPLTRTARASRNPKRPAAKPATAKPATRRATAAKKAEPEDDELEFDDDELSNDDEY